ncbi:MAG: hypothetical protein K0S34_1008 [Bacillales bacterium]|jgi:hypothetical protein|nr:hypothetical protein [Bacillales bacterium]
MGLFDFFKKKKETTQKTNNVKTKIKKNNEEVAVRKGELGEYKIDIQLSQLPKEYKYFNDLMISNPKAKSGYSQIDHVVITPYCIFVIETKNYQGTIYGGKDRNTWLVNGKFKMMNPFVQNFGHIEALKNTIDKKFRDHFVSIVSFTKRCTFKLDELDYRKIGSNNLVVYDIELSDYIHRKISILKIHNKEPLFSEADISLIYETIAQANITDQNIRNKHVQELKQTQSKDKPIEEKTTAEIKVKCSVCEKAVSEKVAQFCLSNKKFKGKIYCYEHQKSL